MESYGPWLTRHDRESHLAERQKRFHRLQHQLASLSDSEVLDLVGQGAVLGSGIGGTRSLVTMNGDQVFIKKVPLTDLEMLSDNFGSTANLFDLPLGCQYGVASPSFGVWREVAANTMATTWVTSGSARSFPVMFHSRMIPVPAFDGPLPDELGDIDALVAHWHDSQAVRHRANAIAESAASVAMFFEYIPKLLGESLTEQSDAGQLTESMIELAVRDLLGAATFMNSEGLWHFDTHFANILANDNGVYLTDFGLASSPHFDLSPDEAQFLHSNRTHDHAYLATRLVNWIVTHVGGFAEWERRNDAIRDIANGAPANRLIPGPGSTIVAQFAPVALHINEFYWQLHGQDRRTAYPTAAVEKLLDAATHRPAR